MLCQQCKKNMATHHTQEVVQNKIIDVYYCDSCYADMYGMFGASGADVLFSLLGDTSPQVKRCPNCHRSFRDYEKTGLVGCADCYTAFREELLPVIKRIHGKARHVGKGNPVTADQKLTTLLSSLQEELEQALIRRDYARASELNARIKEISKKLFGGNA